MARQRRTTDPFTLWREIEQAGGCEAYVDQQLRERGFLIERRDTTRMSKRELTAYKKQLKEEASERRRLRQEAWFAYRSNHIVHLGEGVFWNDEVDYDRWDLEDAAERAAENALPPLDTAEQLAEALGVSVPQLRWLAYHRDVAASIHYRRFTIPKRDGSARAIWAPLPRLKQVQRWILYHIVERLPIHGAAHGFVAGRSILSNARQHTAARIVLKMDLRDFFPSVTWTRVRGVFRKAGYRLHVATLLALLCTEAPREIVERDGKPLYVSLGPRCLPQGAPTSPGLTNALCFRLDRRLAGLAAKLGWRYTRYADDLTFSLSAKQESAPRVGALLGTVTRIVADEGFAVHPRKTRVARKGGRQAVTGLIVNGGETPRVARSAKRQLRAAIHNLKSGKPLAEGETVDTLLGFAAYVAMSEPELGRQLAAQIRDAAQSSGGI